MVLKFDDFEGFCVFNDVIFVFYDMLLLSFLIWVGFKLIQIAWSTLTFVGFLFCKFAKVLKYILEIKIAFRIYTRINIIQRYGNTRYGFIIILVKISYMKLDFQMTCYWHIWVASSNTK